MVGIEWLHFAHLGAILYQEARVLLLTKRGHELRRVMLHYLFLLRLEPINEGGKLPFGVRAGLQRDLGLLKLR